MIWSPQLSYGDTDPKLSDRATYSKFYRTVPSDSDFNPARLAMLRQFNWTRVGTLFQDVSKGADRYGIVSWINTLFCLLSVIMKSVIVDVSPVYFCLWTSNTVIILFRFPHFVCSYCITMFKIPKMLNSRNQYPMYVHKHRTPLACHSLLRISFNCIKRQWADCHRGTYHNSAVTSSTLQEEWPKRVIPHPDV